MPGIHEESKQEVFKHIFVLFNVELTIKLTTKSTRRIDENPDPDAVEAAFMPEDDENENSSQGPSRIYPKIPVFEDHEDKDKTASESWIYACIHVIWLLFALLLVPYFLTILHQLLHTSEVKSSVPLFDVDAIVSTLRLEFDSLNEKNFRVLKAALRNVNSYVEPRAPTVLLVVSSEDNRSSRFARRLAELLDRSYVPLSGVELGQMEDSRKHISDTIRENVEKKEARVFLVSQLQRLPFTTTMIFYAYCDDQNAPYKKVVYVMTVTCGSFDATTNWDRIGMDCLTRSWPDIHIDKKSPLITRLTPSLLILQK